MDILLLQPSGIVYRKNGGAFPRVLRYAPSTLTTLAALVPDELDANITLVDEGVNNLDLNVRPDLVGISTITGTANRGYAIAEHFRSRGVPVVMGGVHPTLMPQEAMQHADAVVTGLAFESWPRLLRDFSNGKMEKRYDQNPKISLEGLPTPRADLLKPAIYGLKKAVQATFGCPYTCDFCAVVATQSSYRHRPVKDVIREIEEIKGRYIIFVDPSPTEDRKYIEELWTAITPLKKTWFGLTTAKTARDDELMDLAAKSGCRGFLIGFETVSQEGIEVINKGRVNKVGNYKETIQRLHDRNIAINGTFMFGMDSDDRDSFRRTVDFVQEANIDLPRYAIITPFPGTPLHNRLEKEGRIIEKNWTLYDGQHVVFQPKNMSVEELRKGEQWAWKQTYKLGSIAKRIFGSGCSPLISFTTNLGYKYYANRLHEFTTERMLEIESSWNPKVSSGLENMVHEQNLGRVGNAH